jgi:hypothetical protein
MYVFVFDFACHVLHFNCLPFCFYITCYTVLFAPFVVILCVTVFSIIIWDYMLDLNKTVNNFCTFSPPSFKLLFCNWALPVFLIYWPFVFLFINEMAFFHPSRLGFRTHANAPWSIPIFATVTSIGTLHRTTCAVTPQTDQNEFLTQYFDLAMLFYSIFCKSVDRVRPVTLISSRK